MSRDTNEKENSSDFRSTGGGLSHGSCKAEIVGDEGGGGDRRRTSLSLTGGQKLFLWKRKEGRMGHRLETDNWLRWTSGSHWPTDKEHPLISDSLEKRPSLLVYTNGTHKTEEISLNSPRRAEEDRQL